MRRSRAGSKGTYHLNGVQAVSYSRIHIRKEETLSVQNVSTWYYRKLQIKRRT